MVGAWEHLVWLGSKQRDTAVQARGLAVLERLRAGPGFIRNEGMDKLLGWRTVLALQRRSPNANALLDSFYQDALKPDRDLFVPALMLQAGGEPAAQIEFNRRLLGHGLPPDGARTVAILTSLAWASRGAWDSALAVRERVVRSSADTIGMLDLYRMSVLAVWVGALPATEAAERRAAAARLVAGQTSGYRADLAWLDGVLAVGEGGHGGYRVRLAREFGRPARSGLRFSTARWERSSRPSGGTGTRRPRRWPRLNGSWRTAILVRVRPEHPSCHAPGHRPDGRRSVAARERGQRAGDSAARLASGLSTAERQDSARPAGLPAPGWDRGSTRRHRRRPQPLSAVSGALRHADLPAPTSCRGSPGGTHPARSGTGSATRTLRGAGSPTTTEWIHAKPQLP